MILNKHKVREVILPDFQTYYEAVIKLVVLALTKNRSIGWNTPDIDLSLTGHLTFDTFETKSFLKIFYEIYGRKNYNESPKVKYQFLRLPVG